MSSKQRSRGWGWAICLVFVVAAGNSGCSTFHPRQLDVLHLFGPRRPKPPAEGEPAYTVLLVPASGTPQSFRMPADEPVTVQEALEQSGAMHEYARQEIFLERTIPGAGKSHRMNVSFDRATQAVAAENDYAIYPGDRLIVKEDTSTILEDSLEALSTAMGVYGRR